MAVDTATKRYAMVNFGENNVMFPPPDNGIADVDRAQLIGGYLPVAAAGTGIAYCHMNLRLSIGLS